MHFDKIINGLHFDRRKHDMPVSVRDEKENEKEEDEEKEEVKEEGYVVLLPRPLQVVQHPSSVVT